MKSIRERIGAATLALGCIAGAAGVDAATINSRADGGVKMDRVPTGARGQTWAYSESPPTVNGSTFSSINGVPIPPVNGGPVTLGGFLGIGAVTYNPTVSSGSVLKGPGSRALSQSDSTGSALPCGTPKSHGLGQYAVDATGTETTLRTDASITINKYAMGQASDPMYFDPGPLTVTTVLSELELGIEDTVLSDQNGLAGFSFWMTSSIPGLETLFNLDVGAVGKINSPADLNINFVSNPLLGLDDAMMESMLASSMNVSIAQASLGSPFSFDLNLNSPTSFSVDFGQGSYCMKEGGCIPEPCMAGLWCAALLVRRRR